MSEILISTVTVWRVFAKQPDGSGAWEHSHISDGYYPDATEPEPNCEAQRKAWRGQVWRPIRALLIGSRVVLD